MSRSPREVRQGALREEDLGVSGTAVGFDAVECCRGRVQIARHRRCPREPRPHQAADISRACFECFAIPGGGGRIADRHQQVGAQDEQSSPVSAGGMSTDGIDELEGVTVGTESGAGFGGAQQFGNGTYRFASGEEMVADASRRRGELRQPVGGVAVDATAAVRGEVLEQRIADEGVAEAVADRLRLDEPRGDRGVEMVIGISGGER